MILKNSKNKEKELALYLKVEVNNKEYIILKDDNLSLHAGVIEKNTLKKIKQNYLL